MARKRSSKSKYRATNVSGGKAITRYYNDPGKAFKHAKDGRTGVISRLSRTTNRFRKLKKFGW